jgi:PPM family protein phosphatase
LIELWPRIRTLGSKRAPKWRPRSTRAAPIISAYPHNASRADPNYMSLRGKISSVAVTDTGKIREHNEDMLGTDADLGLFVLADGMGGYNAGEVASGIAVKTIINLVKESALREDLSIPDKETGLKRSSIILRDAIHRANKIIYHTSKTQPQCEGMGTTIVACMFHDNKVSIAHVGDSRLYRLRDSRFEQMTLDHSLLQELVDRGFYSQEEAQRATNKNYVTRALGVEQNVDVELHEEPVQRGDYYVLCSDGLSDMVEDEDIHLTISTFNANLDTVAKQLIQLSNDNGGRDNVSVVMAHIVEPFPAKRRIFDKILGWFG